MGPSGCGKSTLLKMIAGLEDVTAGDIRIGDRSVIDVEPAKRDLAMVFQSYALYPHMTVFNNIGFALKVAGLGRPDIERRVGEAADTVKLGPISTVIRANCPAASASAWPLPVRWPATEGLVVRRTAVQSRRGLAKRDPRGNCQACTRR